VDDGFVSDSCTTLSIFENYCIVKVNEAKLVEAEEDEGRPLALNSASCEKTYNARGWSLLNEIHYQNATSTLFAYSLTEHL
jgi:hypothetical protein